MKLNLDNTAQEWQAKARRFAEEELIPCEIDAEMNEGCLPDDTGQGSAGQVGQPVHDRASLISW